MQESEVGPGIAAAGLARDCAEPRHTRYESQPSADCDAWAARELRICVQNPDALSVHAQQLLAYLAPDPASSQYRKLQ
jgi:hypothetical protein